MEAVKNIKISAEFSSQTTPAQFLKSIHEVGSGCVHQCKNIIITKDVYTITIFYKKRAVNTM